MSIWKARRRADPRQLPPALTFAGLVPRNETLWCLKRDRPGDSEDRSPDERLRPNARDKDVYLCVACDLEIADRDAVFDPGAGPLQLHVNPHGYLHEIVTLSAARNLAYRGEETAEFTWFQGYAWRIAVCSRCSEHLGWRFTAVAADGSPAMFYGLLRKAIY